MPDQPRNHPPRTVLQFSMKTLLVGTAVCAVLILGWQTIGPMWGSMVLWFLLLLSAHVAGNVRGARHRRAHQSEVADEVAAEYSERNLPVRFAPATRLRDQRGFGRRLTVITISTAVVGLLLGTMALVLATQADLGGIVLGGISAAVLGGLLGFATGSFVMVATKAFQEATVEPQQAASCPATSQ